MPTTHALDGPGLLPLFNKEREEGLGPDAGASVFKRFLKASYTGVSPAVRDQGDVIKRTWFIVDGVDR
jgi:hypothetical protein